MYVPPAFDPPSLDAVHALLNAGQLATLVTHGPAGLTASHLPMLFDPTVGERGVLLGHLARANPQADSGGMEAALAIFTGPDAYISPSWYPGKAVDGKVVPTWNYISVHVHGRLERIEAPDALHDLLTRLTDRHEAARPDPWRLTDAPPDYIARMLKGIVGLRLVITRIEGKWKLSQNRPPADRAGVMAGLGADHPLALAMTER